MTDEVAKNVAKLRSLANQSKYDRAYLLAVRLRKKSPEEPQYAYYEAVMYGDDEKGKAPAEIKKRYRRAANLLKPWLKKLKEINPTLHGPFQNEYFWFSGQHLKQYKLGIERVRAGFKRSYYSQGVGAVQVSRKYFLAGRPQLGKRWAIKAEKAWLQFFTVDKKWYNSYAWYAKALGFQGKIREMEKALNTAARISKTSVNSHEFKRVRDEIGQVLSQI